MKITRKIVLQCLLLCDNFLFNLSWQGISTSFVIFHQWPQKCYYNSTKQTLKWKKQVQPSKNKRACQCLPPSNLPSTELAWDTIMWGNKTSKNFTLNWAELFAIQQVLHTLWEIIPCLEKANSEEISSSTPMHHMFQVQSDFTYRLPHPFPFTVGIFDCQLQKSHFTFTVIKSLLH